MKSILFLLLTFFSFSSFAQLSKCEQKMQALMLAAEGINFPETAQPQLSKFHFRENGLEVFGTGTVYVYNGDTIYRAFGQRLIYGDPKDCIITKFEVEILP